MKFFNPIKTLPFLSIFLILIILNISNQKEYTRLKILIWDTPSLSLGTYITISAGTGLLFSFLITSSFSRVNQLQIKDDLNYKWKIEDNNVYDDNSHKSIHDNIYIERDLKDPSPTINASFRVIANTNRKNESSNNNYTNEYDRFDYSADSNEEYYEEEFSIKNSNIENTSFDDWDDDSYLQW